MVSAGWGIAGGQATDLFREDARLVLDALDEHLDEVAGALHVSKLPCAAESARQRGRSNTAHPNPPN